MKKVILVYCDTQYTNQPKMNTCDICERTFITPGTLKTHKDRAQFCKRLSEKISNMKLEHDETVKNIQSELHIMTTKYNESVQQITDLQHKLNQQSDVNNLQLQITNLYKILSTQKSDFYNKN